MVASQGNYTLPSLLRVERGNAMELKPMYQPVIGLDVHQAKISACALALPFTHNLLDRGKPR